MVFREERRMLYEKKDFGSFGIWYIVIKPDGMWFVRR